MAQVDNHFLLTEEEAKEQADLLTASLNAVLGGGWEPHVWHNMRWCWECRHESGVKVSPERYGNPDQDKFIAQFSPSSRHISRGATPLEALLNLGDWWAEQLQTLFEETSTIYSVLLGKRS